MKFQDASLAPSLLSENLLFYKSKICESINGCRTWQVVRVDMVKREVIVSFIAATSEVSKGIQEAIRTMIECSEALLKLRELEWWLLFADSSEPV